MTSTEEAADSKVPVARNAESKDGESDGENVDTNVNKDSQLSADANQENYEPSEEEDLDKLSAPADGYLSYEGNSVVQGQG